jgi:serine/threonine protein kinase
VGIVHRDLKPGNIFLLSESAGGGSRLLDFGLANLSSAEPLTKAGLVMGSPSYIAPESWAGIPGRSGAKADIYSLGVILFRMLSGRMPFSGKTLMDKMRSATSAERPSLHEIRSELPPQVDIWVERALAVDPRDRFSTAGACLGELLWALNLAPHPSKQKRTQISAEHALEIRAWLDNTDTKSSEPLPLLSVEPEPIASDAPKDEDDDGLPLISVEPEPLSDTPPPQGARATNPAQPEAKKKTHRGLPAIPMAPALPGDEVSAAIAGKMPSKKETLKGLPPVLRPPAMPPSASGAQFTERSPKNSIRAPSAIPERSGLRSNLPEDEWEDPTTLYAHPDLWIDTGEQK